MPVFPAIFERVAGNLLSVDGSATQLPAILLAILLGVDAPLRTVRDVSMLILGCSISQLWVVLGS